MTTTLEQTLFQSVVDEEFRAMLLANPETFGLDGGVACPDAVESPELGLAAIALKEIEVYAGSSTCSWGLTIVCDKVTQSLITC